MIESMTGADTDLSVLHRLLDSDEPLSPDVAKFFLSLKLSEKDVEQIRELSEKANEGELSTEERNQLTTYVVLNDLLAIMQSRARTSIGQRTPAA